jgi:hypothetical protein
MLNRKYVDIVYYKFAVALGIRIVADAVESLTKHRE